MSEQVDTRIVEMQFDDAQFKAGVKDAIESIKNLDNALELEEGANGFEKIAAAAKKLDFSDVASGVQQVEGKLGGLKKTAIDVVNGLGNIMKGGLWTGGIMTAITSLPVVAKSISGGLNRAAKLAQSEFQFKGLGVQGEQLQTIMKGVSDSVSDTAYGLDQAASIASMLFASGVKEADQLHHALMNVSNVAATFNADYNTIADVFTKVASKGKMQGEEFQQLAHQGINAKAVIADYLRTEKGAANYWGLIEKYGATEEAITDMSKDGVIGFDLLVNAMDQFDGNAKKSNETLQGVTANIGSALSRTTADFFQFVLENKDGVVKVLNDVRTGINNINKASEVLMHNVVRDLDGNILSAGVVISGVLKILDSVHAALERFNTHNADKYGDGLSTYFHRWATLAQRIAPLLEGFFDRAAQLAYRFTTALLRVTAIFREVARIIVKLVKPIAKAFDEVFGDTMLVIFQTFDRALASIVRLLRNLNPSKTALRLLHDAFKALFEVIKPVADFVGGVLIGAFRVFLLVVSAVFEILEVGIQIIRAFFKAISPITDVIHEFFGSILDGLAEGGNTFLKFLADSWKDMRVFIRGIKQGIPQIKEFFKPLRQASEELAKTLRDSGIMEFAKGAIVKTVEALGWALSNLIPALQSLYEFLKPVGEAFADVFGKAFAAVSEFVQTSGIGDFFANVARNIASFLGLGQAFAATGDGAQEGADGMDAFAQRFGEAAVAARDGAIELGGRALDALVNIATAVWNVVSPALNWLVGLFEQLAGIVSEAFSNSNLTWDPVIKFFENVGKLAEDFFKLFEDGLPTLEDFGKFFGGIWDEIHKLLFDDLNPEVSGVLSAIGDAIQNTTDGPLGQLVAMVGTLVENIDKIPEVIAKIPSGVGDMFTNIFTGISKTIKNPFAVEKAWADTGETTQLDEAIGEAEVESFRLADAIKKISKFLKEPAETAKDVATEGFTGFMEGIGEAIKTGLGAIDFGIITMFIENCKNVIVSFSALWGTVSLISVFESIRGIFNGIEQWTEDISGFIQSWSKIGTSISKVFDKIGETIDGIGKSVQKDMAANRFLKYMLGTIAMIGTLVAAIVVLGRMDSAEIQQGGIAIAQILGVLIIYQAAMLAISHINTNAKGAATLAGLTGMGFALLMVAKSIQRLGGMKREELIQGGITIGILMIVLGICASAVGALSANGIKGAVLLVTFGILLKTMALTIAGYAMMPWKTYEDGMGKMVEVLLMLVVAARIISKSEDNVLKAAGAMLLMTFALKIMAGAIGAMNVLVQGDAVATMGSAFILVVGMLGLAQALSLLSAFEGSMIKASVSVGILTTCLFGIALAIGALNLVTMGNPVTAVVMGAVLIGGLYAMAKALQELGNKTRQLPNATSAIFNMTLALLAITGSLAVLTLIAAWNPGAMVVAAIMLGGVLGAMVLAILAIGNYGGKIAAAIPAIFNMAIAIAVIGAVIAAMTLIGGGNIAGMAVAAASLAGVLIIMAAAIAILSKEGLKADMAATAMLELAAALGIMALSIALLGSLEIPQVVQGFIALLLAVVMLGAAAAAVTGLSPVFITFDAILAVLALSLLAIAGAFYVFVEALARLAGVAPEAFQSIIDSKDQMIGAFQAMGEAIAAGIQSFFATLIFGVGQGLTGVSQEVSGHGPEIGNAAIGIGKALGEGIIFGFGGMILGIGQAILGGIGQALDGISSTVADNGGAMSYEMSQAMAEHPEWYQTAGEKTMDQFTEGAEQSEAPQEAGTQAVEQMEQGAEQAAEKTDSSEIVSKMFGDMELPPEIQQQMESMFDPSAFEGLGLDLGNVIPGNILNGAGESPINPADLLGKMNLTTASFDGDAKEVGTGIGNAVSSGAATSMADTSPVDAAVTAQVSAIQGHTGEYLTAGEQSGQQYGQGVNTGIAGSDIMPSVAANTAKMASALEPARVAGQGVGENFSKGEASGITALSGVITGAARAVTTSAKYAPDGYSAGYHPGYWFSEGLASGITNGTGKVAEAARRIVREALEAADKEADSHSPSKEMIKRGNWFGEGFAIGIRQTGDFVNQNARFMVTQATEEVKESFGIMDQLLDQMDWDSQPTITPVLDLTDYEAGIRRMGTLDTQSQVNRIGWADRIWSAPSTVNSSTSEQLGGNHIEVHLDWQAGTTANQMAMQLAQALESQNLLEA